MQALVLADYYGDDCFWAQQNRQNKNEGQFWIDQLNFGEDSNMEWNKKTVLSHIHSNIETTKQEQFYLFFNHH